LFFVATTSDRTPKTITNFLVDQLHVWQALKFDGGGSTHLYYAAQPETWIDPEGNNRPLSNYLGVYAPGGTGLELPLQASSPESIYYKVLTDETSARFTIEMSNSGYLSWVPEDGIVLRGKDWSSPFSQPKDLPLTQPVAPGEIVTWEWEVDTQKAVFTRFQLAQNENTFGPTVAAVVIRLPEEWQNRQQEFEEKIDEFIQEWREKGEEDLNALVEKIEKWAMGELNNWLKRQLANFLYELQLALQNLCNSLGLFIGIAFLIFSVRRPKE
jgi:hypothetical protein